jgi:hypothetical protein
MVATEPPPELPTIKNHINDNVIIFGFTNHNKVLSSAQKDAGHGAAARAAIDKADHGLACKRGLS